MPKSISSVSLLQFNELQLDCVLQKSEISVSKSIKYDEPSI